MSAWLVASVKDEIAATPSVTHSRATSLRREALSSHIVIAYNATDRRGRQFLQRMCEQCTANRRGESRFARDVNEQNNGRFMNRPYKANAINVPQTVGANHDSPVK